MLRGWHYRRQRLGKTLRWRRFLAMRWLPSSKLQKKQQVLLLPSTENLRGADQDFLAASLPGGTAVVLFMGLSSWFTGAGEADNLLPWNCGLLADVEDDAAIRCDLSDLVEANEERAVFEVFWVPRSHFLGLGTMVATVTLKPRAWVRSTRKLATRPLLFR